jgi:hypothetical protein
MSEPTFATAIERIEAGHLVVFVDQARTLVRLRRDDEMAEGVAATTADQGEAVQVVYQMSFQISEIDAVIAGGLIYMAGPIGDEDTPEDDE